MPKKLFPTETEIRDRNPTDRVEIDSLERRRRRRQRRRRCRRSDVIDDVADVEAEDASKDTKKIGGKFK